MPHSTDIIVKSNALIQAAYKLTVAEMNIILSAIAQVRRDGDITDEKMYVITANALSDMTGFGAKHQYRELQAASEKLWERTLTIKDPKTKEVRKIRWVQEAVYKENQGIVELRFSKPILPYLMQLSEQFTSYSLRHVSQMKSQYGIRLYELLVQWRRAGDREIEIEWLRSIFCLGDKYPSIKDLKLRVINPAIADVNNYSDLWVKLGQRKCGRTVVAFQFSFGLKEKEKTVSNKSNKPRASGARRGPRLREALERLAATERGEIVPKEEIRPGSLIDRINEINNNSKLPEMTD